MCTGSIVPKEDVLSDRLFQATIHTLELFSVYVGNRLGLYSALAKLGPANAAALAHEAGIAERYAREWLEQQAVAGFLIAEPRSSDAASRRYRLPEAHSLVLCENGHPSHVAPFAQMIAGIGAALPEVIAAYKSGGGVPYTRYGEDFRHGQGGINRAAFIHDLPQKWLPAMADIDARLRRRPAARVADVGCGHGWSTVALANAYPMAQVIGYDSDEASVREARKLAAEQASPAYFECKDAASLSEVGPFDVVFLLESLHDMSRPSEALAGLRRALSDEGSLIIADERVADDFISPGDEVERIMYGWSVVHCLPVAMAEQPSEAIGTAIRPTTVETLAERAGFRQFEILPIRNQFFRFYRLRP
ncbi:MAG: class I SAM-dependent methyltransferase [Bryobacteraceae bacterium]